MKTFYWSLRIGAAACFIGHGAFGIITKQAWLPYFSIFGIPESLAWKLMPLVGIVDILLGISVLLRPTLGVLGYMVFWCTFTALLRPLSGQGIWEFFERAGNYGVPLALLFWMVNSKQVPLIHWVLRLTVCLLFLGHGAFGAFQHKLMLQSQFVSLGIPEMMASRLLYIQGYAELAIALAILLRPTKGLLIVACLWKLSSEALYPLSGDYLWEFVERAGSYVSPIALYFLVPLDEWLRKPNSFQFPRTVQISTNPGRGL